MFQYSDGDQIEEEEMQVIVSKGKADNMMSFLKGLRAKPDSEGDSEEEELEEEEEEEVEENIAQVEAECPDDEDPAEVERRERLNRAFMAVAGEDKFIEASELQGILNSVFESDFPTDGFSIECARSMIGLVDSDRSGKLGFFEFQHLWSAIKKWKSVFINFDKDGSGTLQPDELEPALEMAGVDFDSCESLLEGLIMRYSGGKHRSPLQFDDFLLCVIRLANVIGVFKRNVEEEAVGRFSMDEYIPSALFI